MQVRDGGREEPYALWHLLQGPWVIRTAGTAPDAGRHTRGSSTLIHPFYCRAEQAGEQ